jgi:hypothetical protein
VRGTKTWDVVCFQGREVTSTCGFQKRIRYVHYHSIAVNVDQTEVVGENGAGLRGMSLDDEG